LDVAITASDEQPQHYLILQETDASACVLDPEQRIAREPLHVMQQLTVSVRRRSPALQ
jgi:hypothetical protein